MPSTKYKRMFYEHLKYVSQVHILRIPQASGMYVCHKKNINIFLTYVYGSVGA